MSQPDMFPIIAHIVDSSEIDQRASDGYVNATALCKASGKRLGHYRSNDGTIEFIHELSRSVGIPTDLLIQTITTGPNRNRGTWVHPQVAVHLGQWASP